MKKRKNNKTMGTMNSSTTKSSEPNLVIAPPQTDNAMGTTIATTITLDTAHEQAKPKSPDGITRVPYKTDQNNPAVKEYVSAMKKSKIIEEVQRTGHAVTKFDPPIVIPDENIIELDEWKITDVVKAVEPLPFSHGQLLDALYWMHDVFDRASINMFLVFSTAEDVLAKRELDGDKVEIGIRYNEWQSGSRGTVDSFVPYEADEGNIVRYRSNDGVPVIVYVLQDDACIVSTDTVLYHNEYFKLPNPYSRFQEIYGDKKVSVSVPQGEDTK